MIIQAFHNNQINTTHNKEAKKEDVLNLQLWLVIINQLVLILVAIWQVAVLTDNQ